MSSRTYTACILPVATAFLMVGLIVSVAPAQSFDFSKLYNRVRAHSVILEIKVEMSFGTHTNEQEERLLGTIVTDDGLVLFDGGFLSQGSTFASLAGVQVKTTPTRIKVTTFDDETFEAEYLGVDRFTQLAFAKIKDTLRKFTPVEFVTGRTFDVGHWVALYMLLPEFVHPPLAADIGMISVQVDSPEKIPLTVGFSTLEMASVLFDDDLEPIGVLGLLMDPSSAQTDASGLIEGFDNLNIPLMGIISGERLKKMIADPPRRGKIDRGWLGISLQALTEDIAEFLGINTAGGIIVNDVITGSPADQSGLKIGDVIYRLNGNAIKVDREDQLPIFQRSIAELGPGTSVEFGVLRPNDSNATDTLTILAVLDKAPLAPSDAAEYKDTLLEITVRDLVFADYMRLNQNEEKFQGVVVSELKRGGLAMIGGLQVGDVIQRIGNTDITSIDDAKEALETAEENNPREIIFFIWRDNKTMFVNVKTR